MRRYRRHLPPPIGCLSRDGRVVGALWLPSPNFDARPEGSQLSMIVIHNISLPPQRFGGRAIQQLFTNTLNCAAHPYYAQLQNLHVSSHFLIRRGGVLMQFVSCHDRAWHAGVSEWQGRQRCNDFSIGIELEGSDTTGFTRKQYATLKTLLRILKRCYPITDIVGHSDIAPNRKTDPGPCFKWDRVRRRNKFAIYCFPD